MPAKAQDPHSLVYAYDSIQWWKYACSRHRGIQYLNSYVLPWAYGVYSQDTLLKCLKTILRAWDMLFVYLKRREVNSAPHSTRVFVSEVADM